MSTLTEFLLARIAEDEAVARAAIEHERYTSDSAAWAQWAVKGLTRVGMSLDSFEHVERWAPARVLAECAAKRRIVKFHESWPILAETPIEVTVDPADITGMTMRASRQIAWITERQYRDRFGDEPPTAPMLLALASVYADHPDYRQEWTPVG